MSALVLDGTAEAVVVSPQALQYYCHATMHIEGVYNSTHQMSAAKL
jgi:hypothetical protein